jgi:hypothetical protein
MIDLCRVIGAAEPGYAGVSACVIAGLQRRWLKG